jgi:phage terminase large subunit-like protein
MRRSDVPSKTPTKTRVKTPVSPLYASPVATADGRILPTHGPFVCRWIEATCVYGEGDYFGQPFRLRPFQRRFLWRLYEYWPETGRRRYRRGLWGMGKGNGKTPIAAAVGAVELAGGMNVSPLVLVGAASLKQADLVFGDLRTMATTSPTLRHLLEPYDLEILLRGRPGRAERIAAAVGTNDGPRATAFIADELHEWLGRLGRTFRIVDGAIAKRAQGFTLAISTAGIDNDELELKKLYDYGRRVAAGEVVDDEFLFEWYEAPEGLDLDDPDQWLEAVLAANPAAGDFNSIENIRSRFDGAQAIPRAEFERYHLNRWTKTEDVWDVALWWDGLVDDTVAPDPELPIAVGVDIGFRNDSSAVVWAQVRDERVVVRSRIWENPYEAADPRHETWSVPVDAIRAHIVELAERFPKKARSRRGPAVFYDATYFHESAEVLRSEHRINMLEYPQTDSRMVPASQTLFQLVKAGRIVHDGSPALSRHMHSVTPTEKVHGGFRISKPRGSRLHIDGAVAAAIAVHEATIRERRRGGMLFTDDRGAEELDEGP